MESFQFCGFFLCPLYSRHVRSAQKEQINNHKVVPLLLARSAGNTAPGVERQDLMQNQDGRRKEPCRIPAGREKNWKSNDEERRNLKAFWDRPEGRMETMAIEIFRGNWPGRGAQTQGNCASETICTPLGTGCVEPAAKTSPGTKSCLKRDACTLGGGHAKVVTSMHIHMETAYSARGKLTWTGVQPGQMAPPVTQTGRPNAWHGREVETDHQAQSQRDHGMSEDFGGTVSRPAESATRRKVGVSTRRATAMWSRAKGSGKVSQCSTIAAICTNRQSPPFV